MIAQNLNTPYGKMINRMRKDFRIRDLMNRLDTLTDIERRTRYLGHDCYEFRNTVYCLSEFR